MNNLPSHEKIEIKTDLKKYNKEDLYDFLAAAVIERNVEKIKFLLDNGVSPKFMKTRLHVGIFNPILHIIIDNHKYGDDYEIVELLLEKGISPNEPVFMLPLYMAVKYSKFKICQSLLRYGASVKSALTFIQIGIDNRPPFTKFVLYNIIKSKNLYLLRDLLKRIDFSFFRNDYFRIPIIYSLIEGRKEEVKLCIKYGFEMQYIIDMSYKLYVHCMKDTKFEVRYYGYDWYVFGKKLEREVLNESEVLILILLAHEKDEQSHFNCLPLDVLKLIVIESRLRFSRRYDNFKRNIINKKHKVEE